MTGGPLLDKNPMILVLEKQVEYNYNALLGQIKFGGQPTTVGL